MEPITCMIAGNHGVGKTSLIIAHANGFFDSGFFPCLPCESVSASVLYNGKQVQLSLWETMPEFDDYDRLRPLSYPLADVFILCFSVVCTRSYEYVCKKWYPEITRFCPRVPILLVGTKHDLRNDRSTIDKLKEVSRVVQQRGDGGVLDEVNVREHCSVPVTHSDGCQLAEDIGAVKYLECSALNGESVTRLFQEAVRLHSSNYILH